jgi:hypothetical protein
MRFGFVYNFCRQTERQMKRRKVPMTATERQRKWRAKVRRQKIWGANVDRAARRPSPHREDIDLWPTPPCLTAALIEHVLPTLPNGLIWECAAGDGHLVDALPPELTGREVIASDIVRLRDGFLQLDFVNDPPPPRTRGAIAITNPPYAGSGLGDPFLARTMALLDSGWLHAAVLLQRADAGGTKGHAEIFNRAVAEFTCCWRPVWIPGSPGGGRWWFSWFVWLAGRSGPPVNTRLIRSNLRTLT